MTTAELPPIQFSPIVLSDAERNPQCMRIDGTLAEAVDAFQADTDLRLLPLLDRDGRPVGALFEKDIRRILLNPYGHALLRNPYYNHNLTDHVRTCPVMELSNDIAALVEHYRRSDGREGMILTVNGRLFATLTNRRLLLLAAEQEHHANAVRLKRAERIAQAGEQFELQSGALASQMVALANAVQHLAEATADRSSIAGSQASSVAAAALQTRDSLTLLADRGDGLAHAFERIEESVAGNREIAGQTRQRVADGNERARELLEAARSIDSVMSTIGAIAGTVNLLSLNAAIEAARAGSAGRGFAVVAGEIRKLSDQTHEATQSIGVQVQSLRDGIEQVAGDYGEIVDAIASMAAGATRIDDAIAREADTTRLIARSVADAGQSSFTIEQAVTTIVRSVGAASTSARELDGLANDLRSGASALGQSVTTFLDELRAA